jgi:hypothetical protein
MSCSEARAYVLRSPENARRLLTAIERLESGGGTQHELAESDATTTTGSAARAHSKTRESNVQDG